MKKLLLLFTLILFGFSLKAQIVQITNETFESTLFGWAITPSTSWQPDTNLYAGGHTSYRGYVPISNQPGDTSILTSPFYDFSSYGYVWLTFNQICKVSASDICQIEYRADYVGSPWKAIPTSSYEGNGMYTNARFSQDSYTDWQPGDSLATPTNAWWKTENFDISDEVSFAKVQFRFKITRGTALGTYFVHGWLIDNFQITASVNPIAPPVVEFISNYSDTVYNTGPFIINAKVASCTYAPIITPKLKYAATYNSVTTYDSIVMTATAGDTIWTATIPQHVYGTSIIYSIHAADSVGNTNFAQSGFYLKRSVGASATGHTYYYPSDTTGATNNNLAIIFHPQSANSWSRSLYLASDIGASTQTLTIASLAWYNRTYNFTHTRTDLKVYMKCTTAVTNTNLVYENPITNGATLVYSGSTTTQLSWNEIKLMPIFFVPAGSNLMIYFEDSTGVASGTGTIYWAGHADNTKTVYQYGTGSPSLSTMCPLMRFGLGVICNDTNAVALHSIDNPTKGTVGGTQPVKVTIKNRGIGHLDSCNINWTVNNVLQTPLVWRGYLPEDFNDTLTLGYYTQSYNDFDTIVAWVSMPNGVVDTTTWDDTLRVVSYGCFGTISGEFIVGTAPGADIPSVNDALFIGSMCGINGDITLKLQNGTYVENWDFSNLTDLMGNYTLTITSLSGNRDSVILKPASGVGIVLNNTDNLVVKNITIDNTASLGYGIQFTGAANHVEIRNNNFIGDTIGTTAANSPAPIYKGSATGIANDIRFIGNTIEGGYHGIYFYGGTGTTDYGYNITIDSNIITNQYYYASYFYYTDFTSVSHNTFLSRTANTDTYWYGLRFYYCNFNADGNKIHQRATSISSPSLAYLYYAGSYNTTLPSVFSNNELIGYTTTTYYGMYAGTSNNLRLCFRIM